MFYARLIFLILPIFVSANQIENSDTIVNTTNKNMLCVAYYPSIYAEKKTHTQTRNLLITPHEEIVKIIKPGESYKKKREGHLNCFNEFVYVKSRKKNNIEISNNRTLQSHLVNHNVYDITMYENKDRDYVEKEFGIAQSCGNYKNGKYCNQTFGLDIYYDKDDKVKSIYMYGNTVKNGKLPFKPESIYKLRNNEGPLGLWIIDNYKKIFSKKPTYSSNSIIMWTDLSEHIKQVSVIPKNGHFQLSRTIKNNYNLFKDGWNNSEDAIDYIQSIEVEYR